MWLRIFQHLLPRARAWRITVLKTLRSFFEGLTGLPMDARQFIDDVHDDLYPNTTRQVSDWEEQFGITPSAGTTDADRRSHIDGAWKAQGGQSPRYLQDVVQAAGFPLYIHEWWVPGSSPRTLRDPHEFTNSALIGSFQCTPHSLLSAQPQCTPGDDPPYPGGSPALAAAQPQCNRYLANEINYIVDIDLTRNAPPAIPDDENSWHFFVTFCGATYGTFVDIPAARREELEILVRKLCPAQDWIVLLCNYV